MEHDLRDELDRMAAAELRSRSWMADKLLRESIAARAAQLGRMFPDKPTEVAQ
jgi:hypothetical protein